jgi:hypothetical protein
MFNMRISSKVNNISIKFRKYQTNGRKRDKRMQAWNLKLMSLGFMDHGASMIRPDVHVSVCGSTLLDGRHRSERHEEHIT